MIVMLSICLRKIQRISLPWYSWRHYVLILTKRKNGLNFVVLKDVPDVYQLKLLLHWKPFFRSWWVFNRMRLYIENVILFYSSFLFVSITTSFHSIFLSIDYRSPEIMVEINTYHMHPFQTVKTTTQLAHSNTRPPPFWITTPKHCFNSVTPLVIIAI